MSSPMLGGRAPDCDVQISEEYVSRNEFKLTLTREGWIFEILSNRKVRVSEKSYKPDQLIYLDTGDVIHVGAETKLLFVNTGDDTEAALAEHRRQHPAEAPEVAPPLELKGRIDPDAADGPGPAEQPPQPELETPAPSLADGPEVGEKVSNEALQTALAEKERLAKRKKYGVVIAVYFAVMVVLFLLLSNLAKRDGGPTHPDEPPQLAAETIEALVNKSFPRPRDDDAADRHLAKAKERWDRRAEALGNVFRAVRNFKLYLAYSHEPVPPDSADEDLFQEAKRELITDIRNGYRKAYGLEKAERWRASREAFEKLVHRLPCEESDPEQDILENVNQHISYIRALEEAAAEAGRRRRRQ